MTSSKLVMDDTAIVTGGSSGLGRGIAMTFAEHGADVVIADIREEPRKGGQPTAEKIEAETERSATFVECDVSDSDQFGDVIDAAEAYGGVDTLVNNAAIAVADDNDISQEKFDEYMAVNIRGYYYSARAVANEWLKEEREGSIVNISSTEAVRVPAARPVYAATRGAIRNMTFGMAGNLAPAGIRVNALYPGLFKTAMTTDDIPLFEHYDAVRERIPLDRHGEPSEIGGPAVFLASDLASYVTAAEMVVDGGITYVS